jgi:2-oxoglutarate dehydrogenase E2 component (dihydrolipoamide succinyltransferase)
MEATILKWHKQPGDTVAMDETVLEIATDKVDSEVPSTAAGVLSEILFNVNDVVPIGTVIARIKTGAGRNCGPSNLHRYNQKLKFVNRKWKQLLKWFSSHQASSYKPQTNGTGNRFYSPLVLNIAAK